MDVCSEFKIVVLEEDVMCIMVEIFDVVVNLDDGSFGYFEVEYSNIIDFIDV